MCYWHVEVNYMREPYFKQDSFISSAVYFLDLLIVTIIVNHAIWDLQWLECSSDVSYSNYVRNDL